MTSLLQQLLALRFRLSTQLYAAIWSAVVLTVSASIVSWFFFNQVGTAQNRVNEGTLPEVAAAFGAAQYSSTLVSAAPQLTTASTPAEFARVSDGILEAFVLFEDQLDILEGPYSEEASFQRVRSQANNLSMNINTIRAERSQLFRLRDRRQTLGEELATLRSRLDDVVGPAIDDQFFYIATGYRVLGEPPAPSSEHLSELELTRYRNLSELQGNANIATELLANAFTLSNASQVEPLRERFEAAVSRITGNLASIEDSPLYGDVSPVFDELFAIGTGEGNGFDIIEQELRLTGRQEELLDSNDAIAVDLVVGINDLVSTAQLSADEAIAASSRAILTGRTILLGITGISIGGGVVIAWFFVGRWLLRRLKALSDWMRRMASGDLEAEVEIGGQDEVAEMAAALEVFRRHALEVQRLNLVEKLAEELQGKNEQLESVLGELQKAQDQIVMREKLAALGELTAGVAHEIRNPLNFVKNFSELSIELIAELKEVLQENEASLTDEQKELVEEISKDISENLDRITHHGERANRIVQDMLRMGRGSGDRQATNVNTLLEEHARLAYHSARATNPDFNLTIEEELDPDMGHLEVISQDMGRVFLNMVSNACYATHEKRMSIEQSGEKTDDGKPYLPILRLATKRGEETAEIHIRDNGTGIPPEAVDKIFNPFFTTKPTDKGTGLGLAMCNDIIRGHGGSIRVESEPGEYTNMIISLPLVYQEGADTELQQAES